MLNEQKGKPGLRDSPQWVLWVWTFCYYAAAMIIFAAAMGRSKDSELFRARA